MTAEQLMEILKDAITRKGTVGFSTGAGTHCTIASAEHPLLEAFIRPDGLIEASSDEQRNLIDPHQVIVAGCRNRTEDDQTGQYA